MALTKITTPELFDFSDLNTALQLPTGTTAERPTSPGTGEWRYNTDLKYVEFWDGAAWFRIDTDVIIPAASEHFNTSTYFGTGANNAVTAKLTNAANFDDSSSNYLLGTTGYGCNGARTRALWVKIPALPASGQNIYIVNQAGQADFTDMLALNTDGTVRYFERPTSYGGALADFEINSSVAIAVDTWTHVAVTTDGGAGAVPRSGYKLYFNGTEDTGATQTFPGYNTGSPTTLNNSGIGTLTVGAYYGLGSFSSYLQGSVDQFRLYCEELTASEISDLASETTATTTTTNYPSGTTGTAAFTFDNTLTDAAGALTLTDPNAGTTNAIGFVGTAFSASPDFVWIKDMDDTENHGLFDIVRGANEWLHSNNDDAQTTYGGSFGVLSFDTNGYTVGTGTAVNASGEKYVGWSWKGGGAATTIAAGTVNSNTVDSDVSANLIGGFSIVKYTAPASGTVRIAHGLGGVPDIVITKTYSLSGYNWYTWVTGMDTTSGYVYLDGDAADGVGAGHNMWNGGFTSTTYEQVVGNSTIAGASTIGYLWRSITGYSKISSYVGNNPSAVSVTLGFAPTWIMVKNISTVSDWIIYDRKRNRTGNFNNYLLPNSNGAQGTTGGNYLVPTASGFETNASGGTWTNASGDTYIYMAFA